ncbi:MAG: hypothetical protein AAFV85_23200 [Cyanobacteria bacterium J06634_6]
MPFATLSLPSAPVVGQLGPDNRRATEMVAVDLVTGQYVQCVGWGHSDLTDHPKKEARFSLICDKEAAIYWGHIAA